MDEVDSAPGSCGGVKAVEVWGSARGCRVDDDLFVEGSYCEGWEERWCVAVVGNFLEG